MLHIDRLMTSIDKLGKFSLQQSINRKNNLGTAATWLKGNISTDVLLDELEVLTQNESQWQGAIPCTPHPLDTVFSQPRSHPENLAVIGVDGSQIYPDRHAAVVYYLIQCGALIYRYDGRLPEPRSVENLYYEDGELFDARGNLIGNDEIGMKRTVQEMQFVADLCQEQTNLHAQSHIFALVDGPLLWPYPEREPHLTPEFNAYSTSLKEIQQSGAVPVGYVDRPGGRWFVTTLWINQKTDNELSFPIDAFPLHALNDVQLMEVLLSPGEYTPFFKRHNRLQTLHARVDQEIWFCYINIGNDENPSIARIEIPKWFAEREGEFASLHQVLLHQAQVLNGYPYVLARAHELALITTQDKLALDHLLERKLMEQGLLPTMSEKARQKSYLGYR